MHSKVRCTSSRERLLEVRIHIARATVENNATRLTDEDVRGLLEPNKNAGTFIQDTFRALYFTEEDNHFLDNLWANMKHLRGQLKRSLALAAACRAAMKKRPRGIFTFTGKKGWDSRRDFELTMKDQSCPMCLSLTMRSGQMAKTTRPCVRTCST